MTGLEPLLIAAGKMAAPHAAQIAKSLAKRATYRIRIAFIVRRNVTFKFSIRTFVSWLKTVSHDDLIESVEISGPNLAVRLDEYFENRDRAWLDLTGRRSKSLKLVEEMFLATLKSQTPTSALMFAELWSKSRNEAMISKLVDLTGGTAPISVEDIVVWLQRRSLERQRIRLAAFAVDPSLVQDALASVEHLVPEVPEGSCRFLIGAFGSGKSEIAEKWHRSKILELQARPAAAIPSWFSAREVGVRGLGTVLLQLIGANRASLNGSAIVIDGLDEVDSATAEAVVQEALVYVAGNVHSSVLLTSRQSYTASGGADIMVPGLDEDVARSLVEKASGSSHATWQWTNELVETIKRPFFALAAGAALAAGTVNFGQTEIIARLVESALVRARIAENANSSGIFKALVKLSVNLTNSNGASDGLTFIERQTAKQGSLTYQVSDGLLAFSLPIFEQWFASQDLLGNLDALRHSLSAVSLFDRWRWAISIAALAASDEVSDEIIEECLYVNPGVGAWVIEQVAHNRGTLEASQQADLEAPSAAARLLRAARAWINSLGAELAPKLLPIRNTGDPIGLGFRLIGPRSVFIAWSDELIERDSILDIPDGLAFYRPSPGWRPYIYGELPTGTSWPWVLFRDRIARNILPLLNNDRSLGPAEGVWQLEGMYRTARAIYNGPIGGQAGLERERILGTSNQLLGARTSDNAPFQGFSLNGRTVQRPELESLVSWLAEQTFVQWEPLAPGPDVLLPQGQWVWDRYSTSRLMSFYTEVSELACLAYDQIAASLFERFAWTLGTKSAQPFGVVGFLVTRDGTDYSDAPTFSYVLMPMDLIASNFANDHIYAKSKSGRANVRHIREQDFTPQELYGLEMDLVELALSRKPETPFWSVSLHNGPPDLGVNRPSSLMAARWLWDDLKRLHLTSGTFPQLD